MVRHPTQDKYQDREADRTEQEMEDHFGIHLACFVSCRLEKPSRRSAKEKQYYCRYQRVSDCCHGFPIPQSTLRHRRCPNADGGLIDASGLGVL
jgi:hypothetical protein